MPLEEEKLDVAVDVNSFLDMTEINVAVFDSMDCLSLFHSKEQEITGRLSGD